MSQQTMSSHQVSSSTKTIPGGAYQIINKSYEVKEYQYEHQYGGMQPKLKPMTMQSRQDHSNVHQTFQIPIQRLEEGTTQQLSHFQSQNQQQVHTDPQSHFPDGRSQGQFQGEQPQGTYYPWQISGPRTHGQFQGNRLHEQFQGGKPQGQFHRVHPQGHQPPGQFQGARPQRPQPQELFQGAYPQEHQPKRQFPPGKILKSYPQWTHPQEQFHTQPQGPSYGALPQGQFQGGQSHGQFRGDHPQGGPPHQPQTQRRPNEQAGELTIEWPPKDESGPHLGSSAFPSGFKLREEAPMDHVVPPPVVPAQPAFKITQPVRIRADDKWPPRKYHGSHDDTHSQVREFIKTSKGNRDYAEFFAQNALPSSYPSYRAPPGTQHHGLV